MEKASTPVTDLLKKLLKKLLLGIVAVVIAIPTLLIMFFLPNKLLHSECDAILSFLYPTPQAQQADYQHCLANNTDTRVTRPLPVMAVALCIGLAVVWFICSFVLSRQAQRHSIQKMRVFLSVVFFGLGLVSYIDGLMSFETTTVFVLPIASWILLLGIGVFVMVPQAQKPYRTVHDTPITQSAAVSSMSVEAQTRIGCFLDALVFILDMVIIFAAGNPGIVGGVLELSVLGGSIMFAIAWPIRGAVMKNKIRQQAKEKVTSPALTALMLSMVRENTIAVHIPLPQDDALIFVSEPSNSFFKVIIPQTVQDHVDRLIKPQLELYAQAGWKLDPFEPTPKEPLYEGAGGPRMLVPFTQPRFRYTGVILHLRRRK